LTLADQLSAIAVQIHGLERRLLAWHRRGQDSQRLAAIPGVGLISATALAASVPDPKQFRSGREFVAFLVLVPREAGRPVIAQAALEAGGWAGRADGLRRVEVASALGA
jgi:transposase